MKQRNGYLCAFLMGLLTVILCLVIADGLIGVAGTLTDLQYNDAGELMGYTLVVNDHTGKIVFWSGLLLLPILFARWVQPKYTWIQAPLYVLAWYALSAVFGAEANHGILAHPPAGFFSIAVLDALYPFLMMLLLWIVQLAVLLVTRGILGLISKRKERSAHESEVF